MSTRADAESTTSLKRIMSREERLSNLYRNCASDPDLSHLHYKNTFVSGSGSVSANVMFVRAAPSGVDQRARRFVYQNCDPTYGRLMAEVGLDFESCFFTGLLKYRTPNDRDPRLFEIKVSKAHLLAEIGVIRPAVVVSVGQAASLPFIGSDGWSQALGGVYRTKGIPVVPISRPEQVAQNPYLLEDLIQKFGKVREYLS